MDQGETKATASTAEQSAGVRMRIRFAKQGDLRLISHRDLLRTFERLFRRANVKVRMSEGFHPKPRMMFPSALGLGICGLNEVVDVDLIDSIEPAELLSRLSDQAPPGLQFLGASVVPPGTRKAQAKLLSYELPVPVDRAVAAQLTVAELIAAKTWPVERPGRIVPVDLRATLVELSIEGGVLRMTLAATHEAQARPRDILQVLQLADLEEQGLLVRAKVELDS